MRATRTNRRHGLPSQTVIVPLDGWVRPTEEAPHLLHRTDRNELQPFGATQNPELLARREMQSLANSPGNDGLKLRGDRDSIRFEKLMLGRFPYRPVIRLNHPRKSVPGNDLPIPSSAVTFPSGAKYLKARFWKRRRAFLFHGAFTVSGIFPSSRGTRRDRPCAGTPA